MTINLPSTETLCLQHHLRGCPSAVKPEMKTRSQKEQQEKENTELQKERQLEAKKHYDIIYSPSNTNPYTNMVKTYAFSTVLSHVMQNAIGVIQSGTKQFGQTVSKNVIPFSNFAATNPLITTAIGLGALGLLYKTFKNEKDISKNNS